MSDGRQDWRSALEAVVDEKRRDLGPHPGPDELVAYHAGELGGEGAKRLQDHLVLCPECARLLLELDAFSADAAVAPDVDPGPKVVPIEPYLAARRRRWAAAAAVAAAAALFLVRPHRHPLPAYGPPRLTGESTLVRAGEAVTPPGVSFFTAGSRLALRLQPESAVDGPVTARVYVRRDAELRALSAATLEVRRDGVVFLDGIVDTELRLPRGTSDLVTVVARPLALPTRSRLARELAVSDPSRGGGWIGFQSKVHVEETADGPLSKVRTAGDDGPWVEYAGCRTIGVGPICHLRPHRKLTVWVRHPRQDEIRIEPGGWGKSHPPVEVQDGYRYDVEVGWRTAELVVEVRQDEKRSIWALELEHATPPPWLAEAWKRYEGEDWNEARRLIEPRVSDPNPADRGAALSLLARIEHRSGNADLRDRTYRRAIEAHRRAGRLFDQIRDASGFAYHLIREKRFSEARELLDSLPVDETAGAAESRSSVAYARGLLAEKMGDFRAAFAWMTRAIREAERAGSSRRRIFAEDILARQLYTVGLEDAAADLYARMRPRMASLCGGETSELDACDCARFQVNRAWTALLALEAGRPVPDTDPRPLLDEAERIFMEQNARGEELSCVSPEDLPNLRLNRAILAHHDRDAEEARRQLARAEVDPEAFPSLALWQLDVEARIWLADDRPERALDLYEDLGRRATLGAAPEAAWRAAAGRAAALEGLGRTGDALEACAEAEGLLDRESLLVPMHEGRERFVAQRERATRFCLDLLLRSGRRGEALAVARRAAARALRQLRVSAGIAALEEADRNRWERIVDSYWGTRKEIQELRRRIWRGLPDDEMKLLREEIKRRSREGRALLDQLSTLTEGNAPDSRELAPPARNTVLLAYHPLPLGWVALAADEQGVTARRVEPAGEKPLEARSPEELSALLLEPFAEKIRRAEEVQLIPYGSLRAVDFHALPFDGATLLDRVPVVYRLDLSDPAPGASTSVRRALVVSGPGLVEAPGEVREVRSALESRSPAWQVELLEGDGASEPAVRQRLPEVGVLHFAGHADFDEDSRGWDSHLSLAGGGRLTVDDVLASRRVPRWVVLSGCETGRDERTAPAPTIGLAQAFLVAGAESVVAVTADVQDHEAAALSEALYRYWYDTSTLAAALRKAQLELRDEAPESGWRRFRILVR